MRIALLGTRGVPAHYGGFETAVEEVGARLVAGGHEVTVYCRNPGQKLGSHRGMTLVNLPALRRRAAETISHTALSVGHALLVRRPDVALVFNAANAPFLKLLAAAGVPTAMHVDGLEWKRAKWGKRASQYYIWAESASAKWADVLIADARAMADHLQRAHGVDAEFIPYGAPVVFPCPERLAEVGVRSHEYHLVVARFEPENNVRQIVEGYVGSGCRKPLLVVGDAAYGHRYRSAILAAARGDHRVRFLGSIWDDGLLDALYAGTLTYVHGHSVGGTNPSLLRAMGAGAPVVAYDVVFNHEVAGPFARYFRTPSQLATLLRDAERNPVAADNRGSQGRAHVTQEYRWEDVAAAYESLVTSLYGRQPRAAGRFRIPKRARNTDTPLTPPRNVLAAPAPLPPGPHDGP